MSYREDLRLNPDSSYEMVRHTDVPRVNGAAAEEDESDDEWGGDTDDEDEEEEKRRTQQVLPPSLETAVPEHRAVSPPAPTASDISLPPSLRAGPPQGFPQHSQISLVSAQSTGSNPWQGVDEERQQAPNLRSNNPFLRTQHSGQANNAAMESSTSVWADVPTTNRPTAQVETPSAVELPTEKTPTDAFAQLSVLDQHPSSKAHTRTASNPDQPPLLSVEAERESNLVGGTSLGSACSPGPARRPPIPVAQDFSQQGQPVQAPPAANVWDDLDSQFRADEAARKELAHMNQSNAQSANPWVPENRPVPEAPPDLPPRRSQDEEPAPSMPPRPQVQVPPTIPTASADNRTESPNTTAQRQRKEHYSIKHVRWFDASFDQMRESPILIQNLNGPCPLLALVNALVLSTAPGLNTGLIETLRTREQVSLGLLLDSVFDELVSGRRGDTAANLPDVSELYQFLLTLHTGMNVNPRFVPKSKEAPNLMDAEGPVAEVQSTSREPGGFEETKEMRLYSTFDVPLIHGWLPPKGSEAYNAFDRSAKSFEDAQNIQFYEEELDERLRNSGLNPDEIRQFEDITTIKEFLNRWPTQLTDYGLDTIKQQMRPASISIFFRNDHFSTLYKEPATGRLMALVTDAGYSTHEEIVWECLSDVNGRDSEFFSGDFRPVGGPASAGPAGPAGPRGSSSHAAEGGWTTGTNNAHHRADSLQPPANPRDSGVQLGQQESGVLHADGNNAPVSPNTEQEDHDLALALQLQEEEEDRARRERAQRQAQDEHLSQTYLESDGQVRRGSAQQQQQPDIRPLIPPRRNGAGAAQSNSRTDTGTGDDAPPPTYEQASRRPAYHPPPGHPSNANTAFDPQGRSNQQLDSAYAQNRRRLSGQQGPSSGGRGRGRGASYGGIGPGYSQPVGEDRDKCIVM